MSGRASHTAVWTGTRMIIWGGDSGDGLTNDGGIYDPATDTWTALSSTGAPTPRSGNTTVWTGTKMIVWGGRNDDGDLNTGGIYDPAADTWTATSIVGAPDGRYRHTAVWTGTRMIVWGGGVFPPLDSGGIYDPATNTWTAISTTGAPTPRFDQTAVWSGTKMVVWGGQSWDDGHLDSGGIYDPAADTWTATSTAGTPAGRSGHTAVWTGTRMVVWGGAVYGGQAGGSYFNSGGIYDLASDSWTTTSTAGAAPTSRYQHTAVWSGPKMIVWGGFQGYSQGGAFVQAYVNSGGLYDPATDSWVSTAGMVPTARYLHTAVWTGARVIVWGGAPTPRRAIPVASTIPPRIAGRRRRGREWRPRAAVDTPQCGREPG